MKLSSNKIKLNFLFVIVLILVTFGSYLFIQKVYALQFIESDFFENQALLDNEHPLKSKIFEYIL